MSVAGRVVIGFSKPWVADYKMANGAISFENAMVLARGVSVSLDIDSSDSNDFYADNQVAETDGGTFTSATVTLTVDGLFTSAERFLFNLPTRDSDGWVADNDNSKGGYKAIGYIVKYRSGGRDSYVPTVIVKTSFSKPGQNANTQEDEIDWQTQELSARVLRGDDSLHTWRYISEAEYETEELAEEALKKKLNYTDITYTVTQNLTDVTSSFSGTSVNEGASFTAVLTADTGYTLNDVTVTMGGTDITSTAYSYNTVTISSVTGNIVITADAT